MGCLRRSIERKALNPAQSNASRPLALIGAALVGIAFLWCYRPELADLWNEWHRSDEHSSGLLVPILAVYILWTRREELAQCRIEPSLWWGLLAFAAAQLFRLFGLYDNIRTVERASLVLTVAALVLLLMGWRVVRKVFTVLLFLFLMVPWPKPIQERVALPMQSWATASSVFCLETAGYEVTRHGNVIDIEGTQVEVAWACNGLRMVTAFIVISGMVVLLVKRAWWEKLIILTSSLPIALLCNTVRLTITSIVFTMVQGKQAEDIFHDFGGYAMMPLALAVILVELWLLKALTTNPAEKQTVVITRRDA